MQDVTELFEQLRRYKLDGANATLATLNSLQCTACLNKQKKKPNEKYLKREDEILAREFEGYLTTVMDSLANQMGKSLTAPEKRIEVLKSKFFLTDVCFEKAVEILASTFGNKGAENQLVSLFTSLRN